MVAVSLKNKQKTAYEISLCDWSSDVCSSDLGFFTGILIGGIALISYFFLGIKYALEFELTGSLWFPLSEHFLHYILLRVLHVKTAYGTDELYLMRQAFTQALSLICVLAVFLAIRHFSDQQGGERGL